VARLFPSDQTRVSSEDWVLVTLDLLLANGKKWEIDLRFRAMGPVPQLTRSESVRVASQVEELTVSEGRLILARERYTNPTDRNLKLWVQASGENSVQLVTYLGRPVHATPGNEPPRVVGTHFFRSLASFQVSELRVLREGGAASEALSASSWKAVLLHPRESLTLEWTALPLSSPCAPPGAVSRSIGWVATETRYSVGVGRNGDFRSREVQVPHSTTVTEPYSFKGGELQGNWGRELRLSNPSVSGPEHAVLLTRGPVEGRQRWGEIPTEAGDFSCQGYF
jgi:hypothetical protein